MPMIKHFQGGKLTLYTREEVAKELGISPRTVWQYIKDERLPAVKIKGKWYVWERNLIAFLTGAKSTHSRNKVAPPKFATIPLVENRKREPEEEAPPDPFYTRD